MLVNLTCAVPDGGMYDMIAPLTFGVFIDKTR